jgi:hypothetical protein
MTKAKHAGGRPKLYRREMCARLVEAMAEGLTAEAAAAKIGISARSLFYWQQQHPEFLQAIQEGRQRSQLWWEERALAMANGEAGNTQIVMLGLRNRGPRCHWMEQRHGEASTLEPEQRVQLKQGAAGGKSARH